MATKNAVAKNWILLPSYNGRLYSEWPAGDKPGSGVSITSVAGTVANGNTLTLAGTDLWNRDTTNWDSGWSADKAGFEGANPAANGYTAQNGNQVYDTGVKLMGSKAMKCTWSGAAVGGSGGSTYFDWIPQISLGLGPDDCYIAGYFRFNANEWPDTSHKHWWLGGNPKAVFINWTPNGGAAPAAISYLATDYNGGAFNSVALPAQIVNDRWYHMEIHVRRASASSPILELWWDGQLLASIDPVSGVSPNPANWGFETNTNFGATTAGCSWIQYSDEFIVSSSRIGPGCKVEIGDNSVYASATKRLQAPTSISNTSVAVTCDLTGLGAGPYWMWATNGRGDRSAAKAL